MYYKEFENHSTAKLRESLLWEYKLENIDFNSIKNIVVQRVIERGRESDFYAIINMYGIEVIKRTIKEIPYLNNKDIAFVCAVFNINKEALRCYTQKQLRTQHWNS